MRPSTHQQFPCDTFQRHRALRAQPRRFSHLIRVALPPTLQTFLLPLYPTRNLLGIRLDYIRPLVVSMFRTDPFLFRTDPFPFPEVRTTGGDPGFDE